MDGMRLLFESGLVMCGDSRQWRAGGQESFYVENSIQTVLGFGNEPLESNDQLDPLHFSDAAWIECRRWGTS